MDAVPRIPADAARDHVEDGALLVCAYDDDEKCAKLAIGPSIPYSAFLAQKDELDRSQEIILFCA